MVKNGQGPVRLDVSIMSMKGVTKNDYSALSHVRANSSRANHNEHIISLHTVRLRPPSSSRPFGTSQVRVA